MKLLIRSAIYLLIYIVVFSIVNYFYTLDSWSVVVGSFAGALALHYGREALKYVSEKPVVNEQKLKE